MNGLKTIDYRLLLFLPLFIFSGVTMGIEKPPYTVLEKEGAIQVREYNAYLVAETRVEAGFEQASNIAFRRLFNYISGANISQDSIAMTAPVNQRSTSEKIAMTAPVNQQAVGDQYAVSFVMPAKYTLETLPAPTDPNVVIRQIPAQKVVAIRYSGSWSQKNYKAKKAELETYINEQGLISSGQANFARYDPPFQLWFLRRNEVIISIE